MKRPAPRTIAFLALWVLMSGVILTRREAAESVIELPPGAEAPPLVVNLNHDPWERLTLIDGIGETLARRIVQARETRGGFRDLREVMDLPGMPDRPLEQAADWLVFTPLAGVGSPIPPTPTTQQGPYPHTPDSLPTPRVTEAGGGLR